MDKQFANKLNVEIIRYRKALTYFAKTCDWRDFQLNAATLFDYLESVELSLIKNKFYHVIVIIFMVLVVALVMFCSVDITTSPLLKKYHDQFVLSMAAAIFFELLLLFELNLCISIKTTNQKRRKKQFVRKIENDFKTQLDADTCTISNSV